MRLVLSPHSTQPSAHSPSSPPRLSRTLFATCCPPRLPLLLSTGAALCVCPLAHLCLNATCTPPLPTLGERAIPLPQTRRTLLMARSSHRARCAPPHAQLCSTGRLSGDADASMGQPPEQRAVGRLASNCGGHAQEATAAGRAAAVAHPEAECTAWAHARHNGHAWGACAQPQGAAPLVTSAHRGVEADAAGGTARRCGSSAASAHCYPLGPPQVAACAQPQGTLSLPAAAAHAAAAAPTSCAPPCRAPVASSGRVVWTWRWR